MADHRILARVDAWRANTRDRRKLANATVLIAGIVLLLLASFAALAAAAILTGLLIGLAGVIATLSLTVDPNEAKKRRLLILVGAVLGASLSLMSLGAASVCAGIGLIPAFAALTASAALGAAAILLAPQRGTLKPETRRCP